MKESIVALLAAHLTPQITRKAAQLPTQAEVDGLFDESTLPIRGPCAEETAAA